MAKARGVEAKLASLRSLPTGPVAPATVEVLRQGLADSSNLVVAEAAQVIGERQLKDLGPDLEATFERLMIEPERSDKRCRGKIAVVAALNALDYPRPDVFLRGITHVQEPGWGDERDQDAAGPLRAECALALARRNQPELLELLVDLLLDKDKRARAGAARALGGSGSLAAIPLLRFKALTGDDEPEVLGESFTALLTLAAAESLSFVVRFLHAGSKAVQELAAFALAESRRPDAFTALADFYPDAPPNLKESLLLAIAMLRLPAAVDFLVAIVAAKDPFSRAALSALAIHRHNPTIKNRVAAAVAANADPAVRQWFDKKFPDDSAQPQTEEEK
jgi:HEAT repeat protein